MRSHFLWTFEFRCRYCRLLNSLANMCNARFGTWRSSSGIFAPTAPFDKWFMAFRRFRNDDWPDSCIVTLKLHGLHECACVYVLVPFRPRRKWIPITGLRVGNQSWAVIGRRFFTCLHACAVECTSPKTKTRDVPGAVNKHLTFPLAVTFFNKPAFRRKAMGGSWCSDG